MHTYRYIICIYIHTFLHSLLWVDGESAKNLLTPPLPPSATPKVSPLLTTKQQFSSYNPTEFLAAVIALAPFLF